MTQSIRQRITDLPALALYQQLRGRPLALGAAAVALRGFPPRALILALALVASLAFALVPTRLPRLFDLLFVTAAILNAAGYAWNLFGAPGPWDEITHGFTIGTLTLGIGYLRGRGRAERRSGAGTTETSAER